MSWRLLNVPDGAGYHEVPRSLEPSCQWGACFVEDRASPYAYMLVTCRAHQSSSACTPRLILLPARGTDEPLGPAQLFDVPNTRIIVGEHLDELAVRPRVVLAGNQPLDF